MRTESDNRGRWWSFLAMAGRELRVPFGAAALGGFALLALVFRLEPRSWMFFMPGIGFLAGVLWRWTLAYRRLQALDDLPLASIGTAAQGYARLEGRAAIFPGKPLTSPVTGQPCCWYRYRITTFDREGEVESTESDVTNWSFMLTDPTGECVVDPVGARIVATRVNSYRDKQQHWVEEVILARDPLCVIGEFTTSGTSVSEAEIDLRTGQLLAEWKKQRQYTLEEWDGVRAKARQEVEADIARNPPQPQHGISRPRDGRPYVISAESDEQLARDLAIWAWVHVVLFVIGTAALAWLWRKLR